ncbi:carbohydrate-binding domain-containing protein [Glutamicibacter protophormiae]|uniref:carbohydrate-binding domain-containing protein n=1 Tax=Glutamicibacter protophormiae TaxID=37930 RepID=UPI00195CF147|nr:carbohydrate-binding domain-containing protein [Glutamicibacter protophormiae]QRQ80108.1 carbohydrate-binding domain-containing protein [Glutamicibacter protophormiae]
MTFPFRPKALASVAVLALAAALAGCSAGSTKTVSEVTGNTTFQSAAVPSSSPDGSTAAPGEVTVDTHFDAGDLKWDADAETRLTLADSGSLAEGANAAAVSVSGGTVRISAAGTYRVSGTLGDGQLVVDAPAKDPVRIILDGAQITSSTGPAILVNEADEVLLHLAQGSSNAVSDAPDYADTGADAPNAAIYSMADLAIAGEGALTVEGNYQDGIASKDGLVLDSGRVTVAAADDGIKGKDYVLVLGGNCTVTAAGDGISSTNDSDADRGWLHQYAGQLTVSAGDDGLKAQTALSISGGTAVVSDSTEALEAADIHISGGTVNATASDDGLNAAGAASPLGGGGGAQQAGDVHLAISGGSVTVNAEGDGLDSNGGIAISGGRIVVNGPAAGGNGSIDANGDVAVTGGVLAAAGSDSMAQGLGGSSTQGGLQVSLGSAVPAGTVIQVADSAGKLVATFVASKPTENLVYSAKGIENGRSYTISTGGSAEVAAGLGAGSLDGAVPVATVTAGQYASGLGGGPGGR